MKCLLNRKAWIIVILVAMVMTWLFLNAGKNLVREDKLQPADLIVVLMGSGPDRILEAVDLYKAGYSTKILMVENNQPGFKLLKSRGVSIPRDAYLAKSVGVQLGVPAAAFIILPADAKSTQEEADRIKQYLKNKPELQRMIVVSSRYHTSRAGIIFERTFDRVGQRVQITVRPSRYDTFNQKAWWKKREDTKQVVYEYIKLLAFYTVDR